MSSFAFVVHPIDPKRDVARKYPALGRMLPESWIHFLSRFWPPVLLSSVRGARSQATGAEIEGWLIAVPYTAQRMLELPTSEVYRKIVAAGRLAEKLGADVLGLGAYTSVVGDGGITIARELDIPVTTGDSYTVAVSAEATVEAARQMGLNLARARLAIVGASGAIGCAVAQLLAPQVGDLVLVGRDTRRLGQCASVVEAGVSDVRISAEVEEIRNADVVVTVTSSGGDLVRPKMLRRGAIVCDVSRPRDVSWQTSQARNDVLVVDGGLVSVPGEVDFGFDFGLPPQLAYACMAETMTLAFEGLFEDFSVGKDLSIDEIRRISTLATHHGFRLAALRSFERKLDDDVIQRVKARAYAGG